MYCSIHANVYFRQDEQDVSNYLNKVNYIYDRHTGDLKGYTGKLQNNYLITIKNNHLLIKNSLATYYLGNNFDTLTFSQTKEAIEKLSDDLHLDMGDAIIRRVDFASNFVMNEPPQNYYSSLSEANNLNRHQMNTTLYFTNDSRSLVFYDKSVQYREKLLPIPEDYKDKNVFRYERRLKKISKLKWQLKDLYKRNIYNNLLKEWKDDYESIRKSPSYKLRQNALRLYKYKYLCSVAIKYYIYDLVGKENYFQILDHECRKKNISRSTKKNHKDRIMNILSLPELYEANELIVELNNKVNETYEEHMG